MNAALRRCRTTRCIARQERHTDPLTVDDFSLWRSAAGATTVLTTTRTHRGRRCATGWIRRGGVSLFDFVTKGVLQEAVRNCEY